MLSNMIRRLFNLKILVNYLFNIIIFTKVKIFVKLLRKYLDIIINNLKKIISSSKMIILNLALKEFLIII